MHIELSNPQDRKEGPSFLYKDPVYILQKHRLQVIVSHLLVLQMYTPLPTTSFKNE